MTKEEQDNVAAADSDGNVEDTASETETPAPEPVAEKASTLASVQASVQDALSTASKWGGSALYSSKDAFSTVGKWKEEGTPLRGGLKAVRLRLNDAIVTGRAHYGALEESVQDKVATSKAHTEAMFANLGIPYQGVTELRRKHPEVLVGGTTLAVALPCALGGRRAMVRYGVMAFAWSAGVVYGLNWWESRDRKDGSRGL